MRRLLLVGCGDIAWRALPRLVSRYRVHAVLRDAADCARWRDAGAVPLVADLDCRRSLSRLAGIANDVLHLAPPPGEGEADLRTRRLLAALLRPREGKSGNGATLPQRLIYISTTGVYGDCGGTLIDETRRVLPQSARARRRLDAERQVRRLGKSGVLTSILRVPGIYAEDRLPLARIAAQTPGLRAEDDVFTGHIHADDLATLCLSALRRGRANRVYHACDDSRLKMSDYFDLVAAAFALPTPPRIGRKEAAQRLSPLQYSFMCESRRLDNRRLKKELKIRLRFPDAGRTIKAMAASADSGKSEIG
ncbi:MAG: sugar nucleotide-binding protein [Betaproteobacteria bacterium]|nr:sugar nucleotide-binding protein [Betaproteobacteria bacterium]